MDDLDVLGKQRRRDEKRLIMVALDIEEMGWYRKVKPAKQELATF